MNVTIKFDVTEWEARLSHAAAEAVQAIRAGVNATAANAKREFISAVVPDAAGKSATTTRVRKQTTPIRRASPANLSATFTITNKGWGVSPLVTGFQRGNQYRKGGANFSTHAITGGGSAGAHSDKLFVIEANGGRILLSRIAGAHGSHRLTKDSVKKIYAEGPKTAMEQANAHPRKTWQRVAETQIGPQIAFRLQAVLDGGRPPEATMGAE